MTLMVSAPRLSSTATGAKAAADIICYAIGEAALGQVLVARSAPGVCAILIGDGHVELEEAMA